MDLSKHSNEDVMDVLLRVDTCGKEVLDWEARFIESFTSKKEPVFTRFQRRVVAIMAERYLGWTDGKE